MPERSRWMPSAALSLALAGGLGFSKDAEAQNPSGVSAGIEQSEASLTYTDIQPSHFRKQVEIPLLDGDSISAQLYAYNRGMNEFVLFDADEGKFYLVTDGPLFEASNGHLRVNPSQSKVEKLDMDRNKVDSELLMMGDYVSSTEILGTPLNELNEEVLRKNRLLVKGVVDPGLVPAQLYGKMLGGNDYIAILDIDDPESCLLVDSISEVQGATWVIDGANPRMSIPNKTCEESFGTAKNVEVFFFPEILNRKNLSAEHFNREVLITYKTNTGTAMTTGLLYSYSDGSEVILYSPEQDRYFMTMELKTREDGRLENEQTYGPARIMGDRTIVDEYIGDGAGWMMKEGPKPEVLPSITYVFSKDIQDSDFDQEIQIQEGVVASIYALDVNSGQIYLFSKRSNQYYVVSALHRNSEGLLVLDREAWGDPVLISESQLKSEKASSQEAWITRSTVDRKQQENESTLSILQPLRLGVGLFYYGENLDMYQYGSNPSVLFEARYYLGERWYLGGMGDVIIPVSSDERSRGGFGHAELMLGRNFNVFHQELDLALGGGYSWDYLPLLNAPSLTVMASWNSGFEILGCSLSPSVAVDQDFIYGLNRDTGVRAGVVGRCRTVNDGSSISTTEPEQDLTVLADDQPDFSNVLVVSYSEDFEAQLTQLPVAYSKSEANDSPEALQAELVRFKDEMKTKAGRGAWSGVEANYRQYMDIIASNGGLQADLEAVRNGISAAQALGMSLEYYERMKLALELGDMDQVGAIEQFEKENGWVSLTVDANAQEARLDLHGAVFFSPLLRMSLESAETYVKNNGQWVGLLPVQGKDEYYSYAGQSFQVLAISEGNQVTVVHVDQAPKLTREQKKDERKAAKE